MMKLTPFFLPALLMSAAPAKVLAEPVAAPAQATPLPASPLPPAVVAMMAPGAKSLHLQRFPMGGNPVLVHLWTPVRNGAPDPDGVTPQAAPIFLDVFKPGATPNSWLLANTAIFLNNSGFLTGDAKEHVTVRWLRPAEKEGLVVVMTSSDGGVMKLITFAEGLAPAIVNNVNGVVNEFRAGDIGPFFITNHFGLDDTGTLTVESTEVEPPRANNDGEGRTSLTVYCWNGIEFVRG